MVGDRASNASSRDERSDMFKTFLTITLCLLLVVTLTASLTCGVSAYRLWNRSAVRIHRGSLATRKMRPPLSPEDRERIQALTAASMACGLGSIAVFAILQARVRERANRRM